MSQPTSQAQVHTFVAYVEDKPGVLNRVISLIRRRGYNIESLNVGRTERPAISHVTLVVRADVDTARRLVANLYKLINVVSVTDVTQSQALVRELSLMTLQADASVQTEVVKLCEAFRARVIHTTPNSISLELTDSQEKIDALHKRLSTFGTVAMVRTGSVAMPLAGAPQGSVAA